MISGNHCSETLQIGIFPFYKISDNGHFPFREYVRHISGKSSYDMISGIKEFYAALQSGELDSDVPLQDTEKIRREYGKELAIKLRWQHGMQVKDFAELFGVSRNTIGNWVNDSRPKPGDT
jgi:hypothetical protein